MRYVENAKIVENHPYLDQLRDLDAYEGVYMYHMPASDRYIFFIENIDFYDFVSLTKDELNYENVEIFRNGIMRRGYFLSVDFQNTINDRKYKKSKIEHHVLNTGSLLMNNKYDCV